MLSGALVLNKENIFTLDNVTIDAVGQSLAQYLIGSFVLALVSGLIVSLLAFILMTIFKRKHINE